MKILSLSSVLNLIKHLVEFLNLQMTFAAGKGSQHIPVQVVCYVGGVLLYRPNIV